jgi:GT2 family glycosyltransferase
VIIIHEDDEETNKFIKNLNTNLFIRYFKTDGGSCKGRNLGIEKSKGDILVFIEDDVILEKTYIEKLNNIFKKESIDVLAGYTFDIVDLTSPLLIRKGEFDYIKENKENKFFKLIIDEISRTSSDDLLNNNKKLLLYTLSKFLRDFLKIIIIQEGIKKGKILASGYRSQMPDINEFNGLIKVEWVNGGNFAIKKDIILKYKFNENMETLPYVLGEDLELSARIGKEHEIYLSSDLKLLHLRSPLGVKINQRQRFMSMVTNFYRIANLRGNKFAYWWSVIGLTISRIVLLPFSFKTAVSELKGIKDGIVELRNIK